MYRALKAVAALLIGLGLLAVVVWFWALRVPSVSRPELSGTLRQATFAVQGLNRSFAFYVPRTLKPDGALVLVLHGSSMNGAAMRAQTAHAFDVIADREGVIVAYPDGYRGHWNDCRAVGDYEAKRQSIDDVTFLRALVGWFVREYKIARGRVFVAGVSNGGQMAFRLAYEAPDLVRAVAAIAASLPTDENQTCKPSGRPVATMVMNGTDDPLNPYDGGEVALLGVFMRRGTVQSTMDTVRYWASVAGHRGEPQREPLADRDPSDKTTATRLLWSDGERADVALVIIEGGGHTIPHREASSPRLLGRTCHDFDAAEEIWSFFDRRG